MGLTLLTALTIQNNKTHVSAYQDKESKKYGFVIMHDEEKNYRPLISASAVYDSSKKALSEGRKLKKEVMNSDLGSEVESINNTLGKDAETIGDIVQAAKK